MTIESNSDAAVAPTSRGGAGAPVTPSLLCGGDLSVRVYTNLWDSRVDQTSRRPLKVLLRLGGEVVFIKIVAELC